MAGKEGEKRGDKGREKGEGRGRGIPVLLFPHFELCSQHHDNSYSI